MALVFRGAEPEHGTEQQHSLFLNSINALHDLVEWIKREDVAYKDLRDSLTSLFIVPHYNPHSSKILQQCLHIEYYRRVWELHMKVVIWEKQNQENVWILRKMSDVGEKKHLKMKVIHASKNERTLKKNFKSLNSVIKSEFHQSEHFMRLKLKLMFHMWPWIFLTFNSFIKWRKDIIFWIEIGKAWKWGTEWHLFINGMNLRVAGMYFWTLLSLFLIGIVPFDKNCPRLSLRT